MTSVLSYPSDPFAASSHLSHGQAETTARYPTPPAHPSAVIQSSPDPPPSRPAISSQSSMSSTRPQQGHPPQRSSPQTAPVTYPDEFGVYRSSPGASQSTSALHARVTPSPTAARVAIESTYAPDALSSDVFPPQAQPQRARHRQSHNPSATLVNASPPKPEHLTDEYVLHPSIANYKQAHPRRAMVGFGPYVLLQTLGEGEFGKVKLGVHTAYGVEVAIKLIRRGSLDDEVRASKVEREIDVLKALKHPNIVRMFDVIDTEKYIGIVLEFAGGGELFDHILANRYLKEKDAQRLFAQLISGVDYLHRKHIVHRDLKLENLLLDKNRNVIITDFGFANRFDHEQDDLMATSCGSPCYAAPELVVSEGLYVGSAVDIWSCGVILYAMLSGYLPYDDDPANPEGDNINLLYKYIMSTKLNFPEQVSPQAKHLLQIMLVPNPEYRCRVEDIMQHPWLIGFSDLWSGTIEEQEYMFEVNLQRKSQAAKRELFERQRIQQEAKFAKVIQRSQSSTPGASVTTGMLDQARRARETRHHSAMPGTTTMPEYLANAGVRTPPFARQLIQPPAPVAAQTSPILADAALLVSPTTLPTANLPATFSIPESSLPPQPDSEISTLAQSIVAVEIGNVIPQAARPSSDSQRPPMSANKNRHTIQVEYDGEASYEKMKEVLEAKRLAGASAGASVPAIALNLSAPIMVPAGSQSDIEMDSGSSDYGHNRDSITDYPVQDSLTRALTPPNASPIATILESAESPLATAEPSTPSKKTAQAQDVVSPSTPRASARVAEDITTPRAQDTSAMATPKASVRGERKRFDSMPTKIPSPPSSAHKQVQPPPASSSGLGLSGLPKIPPPKRDRRTKGMSLDKFGLAKLLGQVGAGSTPSLPQPPPNNTGPSAAAMQAVQAKRASAARPKTAAEMDPSKKSKRKTLQLMVNRSNSVRDAKVPETTAILATPLGARDTNAGSLQGKQSPPVVIGSEGIQPQSIHDRGQSSPSIVTVDAFAAQRVTPQADKTASSSAAKKVMDWFRRKSLAKDTLVNLKAAGVRSDSRASSFVRVEQPRDTSAKLLGSTANLALSSTSSFAHTAEGNPNITVTEAEPLSAEIAAVHDSATLPREQSRTTIAEPQRVPLASAANKTNIPPPPVSTTNLPTSRADTLPLPSRSRSHHPSYAQENVPVSTTSMLAPKQTAIRGTPVPRADEGKMRLHTGVVDQSALSSRPPKEVMAEVVRVLLDMGLEIKKENEFRLRCTRARRKKGGPTTGLGLGSVMSVGSGISPFTSMNAASASKTDSRGLPMPQSPSTGLLSGGGLRGMLLRRGSSYASQLPRSESDLINSPSASSVGLKAPGAPAREPLYGEHSVDSGDEVKFVVELCRMKNLPGLYQLNMKRMKGGVWSFKFIYQTILERCETLTH